MTTPAAQAVFLHFPKTAGTAMAQLLIDPDEHRLAVAHWPDAEVRLDRFSFVHGHLYFDQIERLAPVARRITLLRHPIERLYSLYRFHKRRPDDPMFEIATAMSFHEFIDRGYGVETYTSMLTDDVRGATPSPAAGGRPGRLELAQRRLETFDAVGIMEYFDYSMLLMARALGRPPVWRTSTANSAPEPTLRSEIAPETIRLIRQRASLDIRIYECALTIFKQQVTALTADPPASTTV